MNTVLRALGSPYFLWLLLSLPAFGMISALAGNDPRVVHDLLHPTGEFSARFMIIAMMATPLALLLPGWRGPRWMVRNRRYFGVAAFGYAAAHTVLYLVDLNSLARVIDELPLIYIWTGWAAFFIFIPLAATSMNTAIRMMGPVKWKFLQRWVYVAAVLTLLHWAALHDWGGVAPALVHFGPLIALSLFRVWHNFSRRPVAA